MQKYYWVVKPYSMRGARNFFRGAHPQKKKIMESSVTLGRNFPLTGSEQHYQLVASSWLADRAIARLPSTHQSDGPTRVLSEELLYISKRSLFLPGPFPLNIIFLFFQTSLIAYSGFNISITVILPFSYPILFLVPFIHLFLWIQSNSKGYITLLYTYTYIFFF